MTSGASTPSSNSGGHITHGSSSQRNSSSNSSSSNSWICLAWLVWSHLLLSALTVPGTRAGSAGCADGTREGLDSFRDAAGCSGSWIGHVSNASQLCASGWRVCTWLDVAVLRNVSWEVARGVDGCLAINAAQDGGRCRQCRDHLESDDMGGIGRDCPHQTRGQRSCISGGRMDASCCVDSHFHKACHFRPGTMTGVVCCRLPVKSPHIVVKPAQRMQVYKGLIFLLTCQASGMPPPRMHWYKDGRRMTGAKARVSVLSTGDLLVTVARRSDTGLYTCEAINEQGIDTASSYVTVSEHSSGCADGTTDGFNRHRDIQACKGVWKGHVRYGKSLCAKGWRVCSPRNYDKLRDLTSFETFDLSGCYAYNAASRKNKCKRCKTGKMAGVGQDCGWVNHAHSSCLANGRVDVFPPNVTSTCDYAPGRTTGVLCCKKSRRRKDKNGTCRPACKNKGVCLSYNRCKCSPGYKGARCQIPICQPDCGIKGSCVRPNKCRCKPGYHGKSCRQKAPRCQGACLNGGRCYGGQCKCGKGFWGKQCQYPMKQMLLSKMNRTER